MTKIILSVILLPIFAGVEVYFASHSLAWGLATCVGLLNISSSIGLGVNMIIAAIERK
jgi:hypothetical protein